MIDKRGEWWRGNSPDDIGEYLRYHEAGGYPVARVVTSVCSHCAGSVSHWRLTTTKATRAASAIRAATHTQCSTVPATKMTRSHESAGVRAGACRSSSPSGTHCAPTTRSVGSASGADVRRVAFSAATPIGRSTTGRPTRCSRRRRLPRRLRGALLLVDGLTKRYGSILALDDVGFGVERGQIVGFLGPNGAGKTTRCAPSCSWCRSTAAR